MISLTTKRFWSLYVALPKEIQHQADITYEQFSHDPSHPSLHFKEVIKKKQIWSARINDDYRVLGLREDGEITWFWIGSHSDYNKVLHRR